MSIPQKDADLMRRLAKEGKPISRIVKEDFSSVDYWEAYITVYGAGEKSARGIKRMISNRLKWLIDSDASDQKKLVAELNDLVWHLYNNYKSNQQKLESIRRTLEG